MKYLLFSEYYSTDGTIYFLDLQSDEFDTMLFPDPQHPPYISSFSFAPNGDLYYVRPNIDSAWSIRKAPANTNNFPTDIDHLNFSVIYEATAPDILRRVRVRQVNSSQIRIYFSRGYGGVNKDGQIYYLEPTYIQTGQMVYAAVPYYTVKLDQIPADFGHTGQFTDRFWSGDFAFDDKNNLYLSNGNTQGASVYRVSDAGLDGGVGLDKNTGRHDLFGNPQRIYSRAKNDDICEVGIGLGLIGLQYVAPNALYFATQCAIMKLDLGTNEASQVFLCSESEIHYPLSLDDVSYLESQTPLSLTLPKGASRINRNLVKRKRAYA